MSNRTKTGVPPRVLAEIPVLDVGADWPLGLYPLDWMINRTRVWRQPHLTAAHLLRRVFEQAADFATAKRMLTETPIALPTIYILAGVGSERLAGRALVRPPARR